MRLSQHRLLERFHPAKEAKRQGGQQEPPPPRQDGQKLHLSILTAQRQVSDSTGTNTAAEHAGSGKLRERKEMTEDGVIPSSRINSPVWKYSTCEDLSPRRKPGVHICPSNTLRVLRSATQAAADHLQSHPKPDCVPGAAWQRGTANPAALALPALPSGLCLSSFRKPSWVFLPIPKM